MPANAQLIYETDTAHTLASRLGRLYRALLLPAFALLLLAALWAAVLYQLGQERAVAINEAVSRSHSLARTLADRTGSVLRQIEHATELFKLKFEQSGGTLRLREFTRADGLLDSVLPGKRDLPIVLLGADGLVLDSANFFLKSSLAGQPFFATHAGNATDAPRFDTPLLDAATHKWHIRSSRRLNDRHGRFAGVIVILVDPIEFVDDYDRLNVGDEGALMLLARGGKLSVGRTEDRLIISDTIGFGPPPDLDHPSDELVISAPFDAIDRIYSDHDLPRYPLTAVVGVARQRAMETFTDRRAAYLGAMALATLLICAFTGLLMQQSRRLRHSMRLASEAQSMLRAAAHGSLDAVLLLKAWRPPGCGPQVDDFIFADLNERAAQMLGQPRAALLGQKVCASVPTLRQDRFFGKYLKVLHGGQPIEDEFELRRASGETMWLHHQIVLIDDGVAITSRDITRRKQEELELRSNRGFLQSLIDHLPVLVYVKSLRPENAGQMVLWNKTAESVTGYGAAQIVGKDAGALPSGFALHQSRDADTLGTATVLDLPEQPFQRPDGALRHLHTVSVPLFDEQERPEYILCIAEDISLRRRHEQTLRENQAELAAVNDASPLGLMRLDRDFSCTYVNRTFEAITGLAREAAMGAGWTLALLDGDRAIVDTALAQLRRDRQPFQATLRCLQRDGKLVWISVKIAAILIDGEIEGYVGSLDDISVLRESTAALRESEARLRTIADTLPAMIAYVDADQVYRFHNLAYEREFNVTGVEVRGKTVRHTVGEERYNLLSPYIERVLAGETLSFEEDDERNGAERCLEVVYIPQRSEDGLLVTGFHVMRQDITMQKREKRRLVQLAQIDALTGLTNRAGFLQKLGDAMLQCQQNGSTMAIMYMDIDRFKPVNDTYGHSVGDALLRAFSARLTQATRASDIIARLGGDEFTIIMERIGKTDDAATLAAKIVAAMQAPFDLDGIVVSISASIGLTFYQAEAVTAAMLLKRADVLLYQAKQDGRNTYRVGALAA